MHWLEVIRLLAAQAKVGSVLNHLNEVATAMEREKGKEAVTVYTRDSLGGDVMICLRWHRDEVPHKSQEGLALADYLSNYGLVDHEVWARRETAAPTATADHREAVR